MSWRDDMMGLSGATTPHELKANVTLRGLSLISSLADVLLAGVPATSGEAE